MATVTSDEEFEDANTSFVAALNVDGETPTAEEIASTSAAAAAAVPAANMPDVLFEDKNEEDDAEAWKKEIKLKFDPSDVHYWFNSVESLMKKYGINKQWSKKDAIVPLLPDDVIEELKPILRLQEADAGDKIYKTLKQEILLLFGPKDEDVFKKAIALRLTGRPSALGKKLIHILCPGTTPFEGCHCAKIVYGFWEAQLTPQIRTMLSGQRFTKETYKDIFKLADEVWERNGGNANPVPSVVAATREAPSSSSSSNPSVTDTSSGSQVPQVAATTRGGRGSGRGGRGGRGNRGGGNNRGSYNGNNNNTRQNQQQNQNQNQQQGQKAHQKGPKASPDVPSDACARHWREGRNATYCSDPLVCSWAHIIVPRK